MASEKIQYTDLIEQDALPRLISELKKVEEAMKDVAISAKSIVKASAQMATQTPTQGYENLKTIQQEADKVTTAVNTLRQAEEKRKVAMTEREKLEKRLAALRTDEAKDLAKLRAEINLEAKALRDAAKEAVQVKNKFKELTSQVNDAQDEFKKLAATHGINSKVAQDALKKFKALDDKLAEINKTARDGRRLIGQYKEAVAKLNEKLEVLKAIGVIQILLKLVEVFQQNSAGGAAFEKVIGRITITLGVFINRLVTLIPIATNTFNSFSNSIQIAYKNIQLFAAEMPSVFGGSVEKAAELTAQIKALEEANKGLAVGGIDDVTKAFEGMGAEITALIAKNDALIDATKKYRENAMISQKEEADLLKTRERLANQMEDDTRSMKEMEEGAKALSAVEEDIANLRLKRANEEFRLATERAAVRVGDLAAQEEATAKYVALKQAEADAEGIQLKIAMEKSKIERDQDEQDLDFLLDIADRRKIVGEQQVADESLTLEQRQAAFDAYAKDIEATFREQVAVIERTNGIKIDIDEILAIKDTRELNRRMRELGLSEIITNRGREVIVERTQAVEDLRKSTLDLLAAEQKQRDSQTDIALQDAALLELEKAGVDMNKVLEELAKKRTEVEIQNLRTRLALATAGSQQYLDIQQDLNEKLLAQAQTQKAKELEIEKAKQEERKALAENTGEFLLNLSKRISEERLADIDRSLEASAQREAELSAMVAQGSEDAVAALAFERKAQAELALAREKEIKRQAEYELFLAGTKLFAAKVSSGIDSVSALKQTFSELLALQEAVRIVPSFKEGIEDTGKGGDVDAHGGFHAILHPNEMVIPSEGRKIIPKGMSTMEVALAARESKMQQPKSTTDTDLLARKLDSIEKAIKQQPVLTDRVFDADRKAVISTVQRGNALQRTHRRLGING